MSAVSCRADAQVSARACGRTAGDALCLSAIGGMRPGTVSKPKALKTCWPFFVMTQGTLQAHRETPVEPLRVANSQQAEHHPTRATCRYTWASGWHANPPTKHLIERTRQRCTIQGTCAHPCAACVSQPQRRLRLFLANRLWIGRARRLRRSSSPCLLLKREEPCLTNPARRIAVTVSR